VTHEAGHQSRVLPSFGVPQPGRYNTGYCHVQPRPVCSSPSCARSANEGHSRFARCVVELVRCLAPSVGLGGSDVLERGLLLFDLLAGAFEVGACDLGLRP